jgi:hypothetical protein
MESRHKWVCIGPISASSGPISEQYKSTQCAHPNKTSEITNPILIPHWADSHGPTWPDITVLLLAQHRSVMDRYWSNTKPPLNLETQPALARLVQVTAIGEPMLARYWPVLAQHRPNINRISLTKYTYESCETPQRCTATHHRNQTSHPPGATS